MAEQDAQPPVGSEPSALPVLRWDEPPEGPVLVLLDQTRLPAEEVELVCTDAPALVRAIQTLAVRGAPLLGIAGAYGVALAAVRGYDVDEAAELLATARPTAVVRPGELDDVGERAGRVLLHGAPVDVA
ncbi:hypothetical protein ACWD3D_31755, partial [Streptomyces sp. NPDC002690]